MSSSNAVDSQTGESLDVAEVGEDCQLPNSISELKQIILTLEKDLNKSRSEVFKLTQENNKLKSIISNEKRVCILKCNFLDSRERYKFRCVNGQRTKRIVEASWYF